MQFKVWHGVAECSAAITLSANRHPAMLAVGWVTIGLQLRCPRLYTRTLLRCLIPTVPLKLKKPPTNQNPHGRLMATVDGPSLKIKINEIITIWFLL